MTNPIGSGFFGSAQPSDNGQSSNAGAVATGPFNSLVTQPAPNMQQKPPQEPEQNTYEQFGPFFQHIQPTNPLSIRPKRLNLKEFLRYIDEIYTYRFENKTKIGVPQAPLHAKGQIKKQANLKFVELTGKDLQEVTALFFIEKFKQ